MPFVALADWQVAESPLKEIRKAYLELKAYHEVSAQDLVNRLNSIRTALNLNPLNVPDYLKLVF